MPLWKALRQLYPNADPFFDYRIRQEADKSEKITAWNLADPQPTAAQLAAAEVAYDAAQTTQQTKRAARRARLRALAVSAVGKDVAVLTAAERAAVVSLLLEKLGVLDDDGLVRPLVEWADGG